MLRFSEHERSVAIEMLIAGGVLKAWVRVSDVFSPDIIIAIRQLYSASEIITRLLRQLKIVACLVSQNGDRR